MLGVQKEEGIWMKCLVRGVVYRGNLINFIEFFLIHMDKHVSAGRFKSANYW